MYGLIKNNQPKLDKISLTTNWPVGPVNVYIIYGEKLTLVDTGLKNEKTWRELQDGLQKLDLSMKDIEQIVITHHHNDHAGLLDWIIKEHPVPVYAHENARPFIERDRNYFKWSEQFFEQLYDEFGVPNRLIRDGQRKKRTKRQLVEIDLRTIKEGDPIPGLPDWEVIETKGHSQDHISLFNRNLRQLICGDHIIKGMPAGIFLDAPFSNEQRPKQLIQYIHSLKKCAKLNVSQAYSGHGPVINHLPQVIDEQLRRIENRANRTKKVLGNKQLTGFEIIQAMYPKRYEQAVGLFVSETINLLDLLQQRKEVIKKSRNGRLYYRLY